MYLWPGRRAGVVILTNGEGSYAEIEAAMERAVLQGMASGKSKCNDCGEGVHSLNVVTTEGKAKLCAACAASYLEDD